jgi:hypothetical protein
MRLECRQFRRDGHEAGSLAASKYQTQARRKTSVEPFEGSKTHRVWVGKRLRWLRAQHPNGVRCERGIV